MKRIAIIPARGGSKRIPRKNIKLFLGKPIIAYSIEAALKSNLFDKVIVSTDDKKIAEIALKFGAEVPFLRSQMHLQDLLFCFQAPNQNWSFVEYLLNIGVNLFAADGACANRTTHSMPTASRLR